jgi:hypothetical protein
MLSRRENGMKLPAKKAKPLKSAKCQSCGRQSWWLICGKCIECNGKARRQREQGGRALGPRNSRASLGVNASGDSCEHSLNFDRIFLEVQK